VHPRLARRRARVHRDRLAGAAADARAAALCERSARADRHGQRQPDGRLAWAFWPDQTDSLAQRDTGWIQYYVESAQEALDTVLQAFRVAERLLLPAMVNLDAFYVSHALEPVRVPAQALVDAFLPPFAPAHRLDTAKVESWGNVVTQEMFARHRRDLGAAMDEVPEVAAEADREWCALTAAATA